MAGIAVLEHNVGATRQPGNETERRKSRRLCQINGKPLKLYVKAAKADRAAIQNRNLV